MKIKSGFVMRSVGGENVVVPVGERAKEFKAMITLNDTGAFLWNFYTQEHTLDEGVEAMCATYAVDKVVAKSAVSRFLRTLEENQMTEK
ncbi:MAG: PqqD family protein [Clostridiales bacterium]|nr:PqqD family protein [Clostridiales bacterium]